MPKPTVYLAGAGPGDPSLITLRALELIKSADCIIYDYLVNPVLLKFASTGAELIYVGKSAGTHTLPQERINQLLVKKAKARMTVLRLKGGDPFIFGRGAEEASYLKKKKINFEIVPGISSAIAVPAYAGIPLTERSRTSTVGIITGHEDPTKMDSGIDWQGLADSLGTMVFLMCVGNLSSIVEKLLACGKPKNTPIAIIRQGTMPEQRVVTGQLGNIAGLAEKSKIAPPAIIVVGEVVKLRKSLNWFEQKPLFGKRVIVTRASHQAGEFSGKLNALGAQVFEVPVIRLVSLKADKQVAVTFSQEIYDWVIFTSQNGVEEFSRILQRTRKDSRVLAGKKICAIGPQTAMALEKIGISPDFIPKRYFAEAIIRHFQHVVPKKSRVLILRARQARDALPQGLSDAGLKVKVIDLYDTRAEKEGIAKMREAFKAGVELVTFTSSSTVKNFVKLLGSGYRVKLLGIKIASIGAVTSGTLKEFGLKVDIQANDFTVNGLTEAIRKAYD